MVIIGAGIFAEEVQDIIQIIGNLKIEAFIEGVNKERCEYLLNGIPIIWIDELEKINRNVEFFCAIGSPQREHIIKVIENRGYNFTTLIHPSTQIFPSVKISEGSLIGAGSIIAAKTRIGKHVIVNRGCLVGHHVEIGNYVTISPGANIAGRCEIGDGSYIGMGAIIIDGVKIGANAVVGAGAVVTKNVPDNVQVVGVPASITKHFI
ncbi:acetyltransferase [uncultured Draconibacterium sp.]|uniref:acetyltransferase n=1 Tax=uncultured Draconibacterium sp. TaxID=1573823 RepID=UPI0032168205